jgi:hypothetical protein
VQTTAKDACTPAPVFSPDVQGLPGSFLHFNQKSFALDWQGCYLLFETLKQIGFMFFSINPGKQERSIAYDYPAGQAV